MTELAPLDAEAQSVQVARTLTSVDFPLNTSTNAAREITTWAAGGASVDAEFDPRHRRAGQVGRGDDDHEVVAEMRCDAVPTSLQSLETHEVVLAKRLLYRPQPSDVDNP